MALPSCPPLYECTFTPKDPPHHWEHWWDTVWGVVVAIAALAAVVAVVYTIAYFAHALIVDRRNRVGTRERRAHALAMSEQLTMQIDAAKGNEAILELVQEQDRRLREFTR